MRSIARRAYRAVYRAVGDAWGGPEISALRRRKNGLLKPLRDRANGGDFPINIRASIGLGGCLMHALNLLDHADQHGLEPVIRRTGNLYRPADRRDRSWFDAYFVTRRPARARVGLWFLTVRRHSDYAAYATRELSIARAAFLFAKYLDFRPELKAAAERFIAANLPERRYLAVHLRATDKLTEAAAFDRAGVRTAMRALRAAHDYDRIFLATDAPEIEAWFRAEYADTPIVAYGRPLSERAAGPIHLSALDGREKAEEAIVMMIVIAGAVACARTCSLMSAFSKILNPALPMHMLNRPFDENYHFPDRELWEAHVAAQPARVDA